MKSTIKKTSFYLVLGFLPLASNFLLAPLFTRFLSPAEYGLIALASLFQNYLNIIIDLGLKGSFSRYYFRYFKKQAIVKTLFSTVAISIVVIASLVYLFFVLFGDAVFALVFKNDLFTFERFGHIVFLLSLNALLNSVILTYFRNEENLKGYALISLGTFFMMTAGAIVGVVIYRYGALGSLLGKMSGVTLVVSLFLIFFFFRNGIRFDRRLLRPLLIYGFPLIPFGLLNITINNVDRFFIERYFNLDVLGQYNIAFLISTIPFIMLNSLQSSVNPAVMKLMETAKKGNQAENYKEVNSNFKLIMLFMGAMLWCMITFSGLFIRFYVGPEYRAIIEYLPLLMLAFIPMIYQNMYSIPLFFNYQSKLLPYISIVTLVFAVLLNFLLIPWLGVYGVALAVLGKNVTFAAATMWAVRHKGFYEPQMFALGKYHTINVALAAAAVLSLFLIPVFPEQYYLVTLGAGGLAGLFIFAVFKSDFLKVVGFVKSKLNIK